MLKRPCLCLLANLRAAQNQDLYQIHCCSVLALNLIHGANARRFFRAPAQKLCAMAEAASGEMVKLNLDHQLRLERFPFQRMLCAPAARPPRGLACEAWRRDELFEFLGERRAVLVTD